MNGVYVFFCSLSGANQLAQPPAMWTTAWAASVQGPYPVGNVSLPTKLDQVFPSPESGARNQSFRLIVRPDVWGPQARIRLSNALGTKPVTFDDVFVGVQLSGSAVLKGTNTPVLFGGRTSVTIAPGAIAAGGVALLAQKGTGGAPAPSVALVDFEITHTLVVALVEVVAGGHAEHVRDDADRDVLRVVASGVRPAETGESVEQLASDGTGHDFRAAARGKGHHQAQGLGGPSRLSLCCGHP